MPAVKNVGEPCAGEPHARFDAAAGGTRSVGPARAARSRRLPPTLQHVIVLWTRTGCLVSSGSIAARSRGSEKSVLSGDAIPTLTLERTG